MNKAQLLNLYAQKGELLTEIEIMQSQLQRINQQIIQMKNAIMQQQQTESEKKTESDKK